MATDPGTRSLNLDWTHVAPVLQDFLHDRTFVTGLFGPLGSAKTSAGAMKTWAYAQAWPGAKIAVIRTTWPRLRDTTQAEVFKWFPPGIAGTYHATTKVFRLHTRGAPAEIMFRAMDDQKDIEDVLSLSLAAAWVDEPQGGLALQGRTIQAEPGLDHSLFLNLLSRLGRQPGYLRMCWLTGNPPDPAHWIAKNFGYSGHGQPTNPHSKYHLYLADQDTNRRNLYHHYVGSDRETECRLCGQAAGEVIHQQGDYYRDLEELFGQGTPLALRFLHGLWIPFKSLKPFVDEWMQYIGDLPEAGRPGIHDCFNVLAVDPAITKKDEGCRSSLTLAGAPRRGLYRQTAFVWRNLSDHWSPYELVEKILACVKQYPLRRICIEEVAWQSALKDIVEREAELAGIKLPAIMLLPPRGDKLLRAMRWSPKVQSGKVLFDRSCQDLIQCMLAVPMDKMAWDPVDATGLALEGLPALRAERSTVDDATTTQPAMQRAKSYVVHPLVPARVDKARVVNVGPTLRTRHPQMSQRLRQRARSYAVRT